MVRAELIGQAAAVPDPAQATRLAELLATGQYPRFAAAVAQGGLPPADLTVQFERLLDRILDGLVQRVSGTPGPALLGDGEGFGDAAVERQCGRGDEARIVAGQERDGSGCFGQGAEPAHRPVHQPLVQRPGVALEDRPLARRDRKLPGVGKVDVDVAAGTAGLLVPYASVMASRRLRDRRPDIIWEDSGLWAVFVDYRPQNAPMSQNTPR